MSTLYAVISDDFILPTNMPDFGYGQIFESDTDRPLGRAAPGPRGRRPAIGRVKVGGPAKPPGTARRPPTRSGSQVCNARAYGVELKVKGKGVRAKKTVGDRRRQDQDDQGQLRVQRSRAGSRPPSRTSKNAVARP